MQETPESVVSMEWIGQTLREIQQDMRGLKDEMGAINGRLDRLEATTSVRYRDVEAALFRADACWRSNYDEIRALRTACEEVLHHLRAGHDR